ncbi:hypothetical protein [Aerosakkonema funiforme]|uniref:hypothetical protein n=1 Tax=Aerosakkonema funiforme TaxID=1246630 RepID=UPI001682E4EA|nr:hypothetical protein [Aerosakkonema funiforme]
MRFCNRLGQLRFQQRQSTFFDSRLWRQPATSIGRYSMFYGLIEYFLIYLPTEVRNLIHLLKFNLIMAGIVGQTA